MFFRGLKKEGPWPLREVLGVRGARVHLRAMVDWGAQRAVLEFAGARVAGCSALLAIFR